MKGIILMDNVIFALDIGTRSVVGVVAENIDNILKVSRIESIFHSQRAMIDGQIEDIDEVSRVVSNVKNQLESNLGIKLDKVSIAAAGRSLKTERIILERDSDIRKPINVDFKNAIEIEALQLAQDIFSKTSNKDDLFYCVGYSVLSYSLDGKSISNIVGHRGNKISIEIIAAFLPHTVIEGLYSCMDNNNLEVVNLTLEPIAAMDLIIPSELRLLNLVLIDIGAGTSDIAISKGGSIVGYDMATIAGDEITECIMKNYIVDFNSAENIKTLLSKDSGNLEITNILGIPQTLKKEEVLETIKTSVYDLCVEIASKITKLNKEPPAAVFLAGGGSKIPFIKEFLSELLNIPQSRIAISNKSSIKNVDLSILDNFGPEFITPVGIAYSVILNKNYDFFSVSVNGTKVRLYSIRQMKVMDAILMSGFDSKKLIGFSGKSLRFNLNGSERYYSGEFSTPAQIYVNSSVANIETTIKPGDCIDVIPAIDGTSPVVRISDIASNSIEGFVYFNGIKVDFGTKYYVNKVDVRDDYIIGNSDSIEIVKIETIKDLVQIYEIDKSFYNFFANGKMADLDYKLCNGYTIDLIKKEEEEPAEEKANVDVEIKSNEEIDLIDEVKTICEEDLYIEVSINDKKVKLPNKDEPYIFADMLNYTDIDPTNPKGNIVILHNGKDASYTNLIYSNDIIIIKWDSDLN
ncbi:cell division protein FtsA [Sedimentibacter acidaminivorans]|uniref:Chaperone protein DnaK n=2 Tax=Sedimentibacter acidaminivorans TaxID=913099 RepID=A0ABS4GDG2_9FIRM|nr:cell division protein FtsA [Sedimentibacter acidaminivorans]